MAGNQYYKLVEKEKTITVYTPINANYEILSETYISLKKQTNNNFIWHVIDYGINGKTKDKIEEFINDKSMEIKYTQIPLKGRFLATQYMFKNARTKYIIGLGGGYKLTDRAVDLIERTWKEIEQNKNEEIAEIRAMALNANNQIEGKSIFKFENIKYIDTTWHDMVLKKGNNHEMLASWDVKKFNECIKIEEYSLFKDKITELNTTLFWSAIGRKYKTRYLNAILKCGMKTNGKEKIEESKNPYNTLVSNFYLINENIEYLRTNMKFFIRLTIKMIQASREANLDIKTLIGLSDKYLYKLIVITMLIPATIKK